MSTPRDAEDAALKADLIRQAADWMARLWADDATPQDQAACARWRAAHPAHELAWQQLEQRYQAIGGKLRTVQREAAHHALREPARPSLSRRNTLRLLVLGAALGAAGYTVRKSDAWRLAFAELGTDTGEIRHEVLPDGSAIILGSASAIDTRYSDTERLIVLRAGQIMISTTPDPSAAHRPLRVQSRQGIIQALGTRFTVQQDADISRVAVFEGAVEVRPMHAADAAVRVAAGQGLSFSDRYAPAPQPVHESDAAWTEGMLVANDMPVGEVIAELARYRHGALNRLFPSALAGSPPARWVARALRPPVTNFPRRRLRIRPFRSLRK